MSDGAAVLLVGGSGFMGAAAARVLRAAGHRVTVLTRGRRPVPDADEVLTADRRDPGSLSAAIEHRRFDFTVDFLAFDTPDVERLLLVPYAALGRYVMISSGQVYLVAEGAAPPFREEDSARPLMPEPPAGTQDHREWSYGMGKRRAEQTLRVLRGSHGVRGTILRLPIVQGEGDASLRLWGWLERMLDGGPLLLPEGGAQTRRFVYAGDVARVLLRLLEGPAPRQSVYNLAQPDTLTLRDFLERAARAAGVTPGFVDVAWADLLAAAIEPADLPYAGPWSSQPDPALAAGELGFSGTRVDDYLPGVVRWHLEHRPDRSHPGYAKRAAERSLAARLQPAGGAG